MINTNRTVTVMIPLDKDDYKEYKMKYSEMMKLRKNLSLCKDSMELYFSYQNTNEPNTFVLTTRGYYEIANTK